VDRSTFEQHTIVAVAQARAFALRFTNHPLPDDVLIQLVLNASCDAHARADETLYPLDSARDPSTLARLSISDVVAELWRDGTVPEWINVSVSARGERFTLVTAECCGRFTGNDANLYYRDRGMPPFHILSPRLPPGFTDGDRFPLPLVPPVQDP
jgi:hypothetical protein